MHRFKASTLAAACPSATGPDSREAPGAAAERCRAGACALKLVMYCVRGSAGDGERDSSRPRFLPGQKCPLCVDSDTQPRLVATPRLSGSAHQRNAHQGVSRKRPSSSYDGLPRRDALHTERTGSGSLKARACGVSAMNMGPYTTVMQQQPKVVVNRQPVCVGCCCARAGRRLHTAAGRPEAARRRL